MKHSGYIEQMNAQVADLAVTEFATVTPATGKHAGVVITPGRRTDIHFPVQRWGRRCRRRETFCRAVIAVNIDVSDFSEFTALNIPIAGFQNMSGAAPFQSHLNRTFIFSRGGDHRLTFHDIKTDWLLNVNISSGLAGIDHGQAMPVIWSADENDFRPLVGQQLAIISEHGRLLFRGLAFCDQFRGGFHHFPIDIAKANDVDGCHLDKMKEIGLPVPATTNQGNAQWFFFLLCKEVRLRCSQSNCAGSAGF